ncbi:MAG: PGPGW domain-containing protein [Planctomycetota bacterium]
MVFKTARRVVIAVIGGTVALIGVAMIVLPGPAVVVIPLGLAILATEFAWAKRLLKRLKQQAASMFPGKRTPGATQAPAPDHGG